MTPMTLSEAIRLGSMLRPQAFGQLFKDGGSCAGGAAFEAALGWTDFPAGNLAMVRIAEETFPLLTVHLCFPCPTSCHYSCTPSYMITHLNDYHHWTRESIADWVESVEQSLAEKQEQRVGVL